MILMLLHHENYQQSIFYYGSTVLLSGLPTSMLTYHLRAQLDYCYFACFKPLGFATFSCLLIVCEHVFYCAMTMSTTVSNLNFALHS